MKLKLDLTLEEIAEGTEKTLKVKRFKTCDKCGGTGAQTQSDFMTCGTCNGLGEVRQVSRTMFGQFVNVQPCPTCHGEGRIIKNKCVKCAGEGRIKGEDKIKVKIPSGMSTGNYLSLRGQGHAGVRGGASGTLYIVVEEKDHQYFHRDGSDIYYDLRLSIPDAILGTEVTVPTLKGSAKLKIEPGIQGGKRLRMKGKGIRELNSMAYGDQYVTVNIYIPKEITSKEQTLIEELKKSPNFDPTHKNQNGKKDFFSKIKDVFS